MLRKLLTILAIFLLLSYQTAPVFAQVVTPTDTPTPTITDTPTPSPTDSPTPTVDPSATVTPIPTTDPNATVTPTPTVDPNTVTPTPTPDTSITNTGTVDNNATSSAISGDNTVTASPSADPTATPSATPSPDVTVDPTGDPNNPSTGSGNNGGNNNPQQQVLGSSTSNGGGNATVNTGNAVAVSNTDNSINTNSINSQFVNQTINIFVTQNGNLDLSVPFNIISNLITEQNNTSPQINLLMNSDKSYAVVTNNIVNNANSGNNSITGNGSSASGQMIINTGNAYSVVSLTNKVNFTIVDSVVHVITINIFGTLNGNIILPDLSKANLCGPNNNCGYDASIVNEANVTNNVDSTAVSGQNTITQTASGSADINTGKAISIINLDNIVNTNVLGVPFEHLFINTFGLWNGNFLGWGGFNPMPGGKSYAFNGIFPNGGSADCPNCFNNLNIQNTATVTNNVTSNANSGNNDIAGGGNEKIKTGNAYSAVQLLNFVNANFIRTFGFFGFINIFGDWNGSIGSAGDFVTPTPTPSPSPEVLAANNTGSATCTTTGDPLVETKVKSNINNFINPGDTALFYVGIKNTGPNDFTSEKVTIVLATNGKGIGGTILNIKKPMTAGKSELVTVGLTISKLAPGGNYTAYVTTEGITCDGKTATAKASTNFVVSGSVLGLLTTTSPTPTPIVGKVLGVHTTTASAHKNNWLIYVLLLIVLAYLVIRGIRSRAVFLKLIKENMSLKERIATLRMLLL